MSKHRSSSDKCCYNPMMYGYGGYAMQGYSGGQGGVSCGSGYGGLSIRWVYALLILILIVLQFGRKNAPTVTTTTACGCETVASAGSGSCDNQLIDNSVLFIIVVFLLIVCSGCWSGGFGNYGTAGYGYTGGYGY